MPDSTTSWPMRQPLVQLAVGRSGTVMTGCSSGTARDTGAVKAKDGSETSEGAMATAEGARARAGGETREDSWELTG